MDKIVQNFDNGLDTILKDYVKKPTMIRGVVHLLLILYVARLAPTPPKAVLQLFDNVYFKLFIFSLVLWTAQFSPSTSVLIALAFMVTMNYSTTGKLWEFMDNIGPSATPASTTDALQAVKVLADAAISPEPASPAVIAPVAQVAASAVTTEDGLAAVKALAEQAVTPAAGTQDNVTAAASTAIDSIVPSTSSATAPEVVAQSTQEQAVQAVQALANAAASPVAVPTSDVAPVAQIALSAATTEDGAAAIQALAQQAVTAEAGEPAKVEAAAQVAVASIAPTPAPAEASTTPSAPSQPAPTPAAQQSGCYPLRNYDMSKVSPQTDGQYSFEDYQTFTSSQQ